ncbi:hypothetical protein DTY81_20190 [Escherichia coli]|nr:hypothetical protein [Escherichia coli]EGD5143687.1 hypothetical protein [Escherichia coli]
MSNRYVIEALLRPAVEFNTAVVAATAAGVCVTAPWAVALAPSVSYVTAAGFGVLAAVRFRQGMKIIRYRRNLRRLPRYVMSTRQIPVSRQRLFLGRGFRWTQKHTQRLQDTLRPEVAHYLLPGGFYRAARWLEMKTEHRLPGLGQWLRRDSPLNPVRPLPPVGGNPALHGIEPDEQDVTLALGERVGHTIVYGTTRVGKTRLAELLAPDYLDMSDARPIFDWEQVIRKKAVVYIGLDALSDSEVASAVGNSMFADLVSVAGHIYKHGMHAGLPAGGAGKNVVNLHCDEFNELMGDEFIPLINKGGGAGMQVTAYTQTSSDIEARIGNAAKTAQVQGNFNNMIMLRVRENRTAELLTTQLPQVEIYTKTLVSGHQDTADVSAGQDFTSSTQDRVGTVKVPLLEPADIVTLPKGQAFALLEGGQLWKIRMPLPAGDTDDVLMPESISRVAEAMRQNYHSGEGWWNAPPSVQAIATEEGGDHGGSTS